MSSDEQHRHRCEVRQLLAWRVQRGRVWLRDWLAGVEKVRGKAGRERLEADIVAQWNRGNRGKPGVWFEDDVAKTPPMTRMGHHGD